MPRLTKSEYPTFRKNFWGTAMLSMLAGTMFPIGPVLGLAVYMLGLALAGMIGVCSSQCQSDFFNIKTTLAAFCLAAMAMLFNIAVGYAILRAHNFWEQANAKTDQK